MKMTMILAIMVVMIAIIVMMMATLISKKTFSDREKSSPFECGFDPKSSSRIPFSLQFFLIAVIFLIFDVEITLLLPMIISVKITNLVSHSLMMSFFIIILIGGLFHEWKQGALEWAI